ncbi:MAG: MGMT family protein [Acidobacteria bacterium]|nr:MGMT family protein [Acidobacteriota bacterium]
MRPATFPERVLRAAAQIPPGKVATYGDLARWAGRPAGARAVGTIIARHAFEVPAHRVVDAAGHPASFPEDTGPRLRAEGVPFDGSRVDLEAARWAGPL